MARTYEERTALDRQIAELTGVWLGRDTIGDRPYEELMTEAQKKASRNKRRAGVIAIERKYGHESAARIVAKFSGRHIQ